MNYNTLVQAIMTVATQELTVDNVNDAVRAAYSLGKKHGRMENQEEQVLATQRTRRYTDTAQPVLL